MDLFNEHKQGKKIGRRVAKSIYLLSFLLIPKILAQNRSPVSTLAWCWSVVAFPFLGPAAYFFFGDKRMARNHINKSRMMQSLQAPARNKELRSAGAEELLSGLDRDDRVVAEVLSQINRYTVTTASSVNLLVDAQQFYPALIERINQARHHVHVEFFIFRNDHAGFEMLDALTAAAKRGVQVRLLCDQGGCTGVPTATFQGLTEAGGKFSWFRMVHPLKNRWLFNLRNHRKIQIIDGEHAFIGGMNVGIEYLGENPAYGSWRDVQMELTGEAAAVLQHTFADDWHFATDEQLVGREYYPTYEGGSKKLVQALVDGPDIREDPIQMSIVAMLNAAKERAWLTTGYFVPNEPLLTALKLCAARGVDVRLLISEKTDHPYLVQVGRSYYEELMEFGVRVFEYSKGVNHAKVAAIDGRWAMVGSANFDVRSMGLNFEANVLVYDPESTEELERVLCDDMEGDSTEIHLQEFRQRGRWQRSLESLFRPLAPLL